MECEYCHEKTETEKVEFEDIKVCQSCFIELCDKAAVDWSE